MPMGQGSRGPRKVLPYTVFLLFAVCLSYTEAVVVSSWRRPSSGPAGEGPCSPAREERRQEMELQGRAVWREGSASFGLHLEASG